MENRFFRSPTSRKNPQPLYAADRIHLECHIVPRQNALHESIELLACLDSGRDSFGGARHRANRGCDGCVVRVEWMYFRDGLPRADRVWLLHSQFPDFRSSVRVDKLDLQNWRSATRAAQSAYLPQQ